MKYPITMSIIVVQTDADHDAVAYVRYGQQGDKSSDTRQELALGTLPDADDEQMWAQMTTALVCDRL